MVVTGSLWLVQNLLDPDASEPCRGLPLDHIPDSISQQGAPQRCQDGDLVLADISVTGKNEGLNRFLFRVQVSNSDSGVHGDDIFRDVF